MKWNKWCNWNSVNSSLLERLVYHRMLVFHLVIFNLFKLFVNRSLIIVSWNQVAFNRSPVTCLLSERSFRDFSFIVMKKLDDILQILMVLNFCGSVLDTTDENDVYVVPKHQCQSVNRVFSWLIGPRVLSVV